MEAGYFKQTSPFIVPDTGTKLIQEFFGAASSDDKQLSIARMLAPPGWGEPRQTPEFDEYVLVLRGKKLVEIGGEGIEVAAGEGILVRKGTTVRYSNPFDAECEYISVCIPAFTPDTVHREE